MRAAKREGGGWRAVRSRSSRGGRGNTKLWLNLWARGGGDEDREGGGVFFWKREGGHGKKWGRGKEGPSLADILNLKIVQ